MAERAEAAIAKAIEVLEVFPLSCRKAMGGSGSPFLLELIIPFGRSGYVALFGTEDSRTVTVLAVRHQRVPQRRCWIEAIEFGDAEQGLNCRPSFAGSLGNEWAALQK